MLVNSPNVGFHLHSGFHCSLKKKPGTTQKKEKTFKIYSKKKAPSTDSMLEENVKEDGTRNTERKVKKKVNRKSAAVTDEQNAFDTNS